MSALKLDTTSRVLRAVTVGTLPIGVLFMGLHGGLTGRINPALGIAPLTFSALMGAVMLAITREKKDSKMSPGKAALVLGCDFVLGCFLLAEALVSYINLEYSSYWSYGSDLIMLGAWGANFLMVNFLVHAYFFFSSVVSALPKIRPSRCSHCNRMTFKGKARSDSPSPYQPLMSARDADAEGEYRDSEDTVRNSTDTAILNPGSTENLLKVDV